MFCEFLSGKRKRHTNGFRFEKIHETKHSASFLSIDFPESVDGHMLVIPKKHYERLEEIPGYILDDVIRHVSLSVKVIDSIFPSCNVLLNNGKEAGQTIFHTHFHIIPRKEDDGIEIESWRRKELAEADFRKILGSLKKGFKKFI